MITVFGLIAPDILYYSAAPNLSAGILSITVSTVPLFTYALMWAMRFENFAIKRSLGIMLGMIAILLLILPEQNLSGDDASFWTLLVLLCAVFYAIENIYLAEYVDNTIDVRELLCGSNIVATLILILSSFALGKTLSVDWFFTRAGLALITLTLGSSFAYMLFFYTIKKSGAVFASQCAYVVTIAGVAWGIIIFSEQHTLWVWLPVLVLMIGLVLVSPNESRKAVVAQ